jgi:hypothetical protein
VATGVEVEELDVLEVDDEVVGTVESVDVVWSGSVVVVVVGADVVVVVEATVVLRRVVRRRVEYVAGLVSSGTSDGSPGPMVRSIPDDNWLRRMRGPAGSVVDVDDGEGSFSETSVLGPPIEVSTVAALSASGAATTTAVTVDSDSASRNRRRPFCSSGRCKYMRCDLGQASDESLPVFYPNSPYETGVRDK